MESGSGNSLCCEMHQNQPHGYAESDSNAECTKTQGKHSKARKNEHSQGRLKRAKNSPRELSHKPLGLTWVEDKAGLELTFQIE